MRNTIRNIFLTIFYTLLTILATAGMAIRNVVRWVLDSWGLLSVDEIIFHLKVPLEGTNTDVVWDAVNRCVPPTVLILFFCIFLLIGFRNKKKLQVISMVILTCFSIGIGAYATYGLYDQLDVGDYIKNQNTESTFIQDNYSDPRNTELTFPEKKRNLIYIFLESMESSYASEDVGGGKQYNCIPELTAIAQNNTNFSNGDLLGGGYPATGSTWTMGAMFAQTSGLPLKVANTDDVNATLGDQNSFSSSAYNLEDILNDEGYNQCFMLGSDATFGGRRAYFSSHGNCEIFDYNTAIEQGLIPSDYFVWWGYEDEKLFSYAQDKLTNMSQSEQPFNLTLLTVDTHFEDGYVCDQCQSEFGDDQYANVMACSSRQLANFITWIQQQPFYDNTTIVLCGDHLTMDSNFMDDVSSDYRRGVYNVFINLPEGLNNSYEHTHNRLFTTMDMFPTTLAALGVDISDNKLGLGVNLFSDEQTLLDKYGYDKLDDQLSQKSKFYDMLINDVN